MQPKRPQFSNLLFKGKPVFPYMSTLLCIENLIFYTYLLGWIKELSLNELVDHCIGPLYK